MDPAAREQSMYITGLLSIHLCTSPLFSTEKNKHSSFFNQILQDCKPESFEDLTAVNFIIEHSICPTPLVIQWRKQQMAVGKNAAITAHLSHACTKDAQQENDAKSGHIFPFLVLTPPLFVLQFN